MRTGFWLPAGPIPAKALCTIIKDGLAGNGIEDLVSSLNPVGLTAAPLTTISPISPGCHLIKEETAEQPRPEGFRFVLSRAFQL